MTTGHVQMDPATESPGGTTDLDRLGEIARSVRRTVLETVHHAGAGHVGGPLSAADLLVALYFSELRIEPARPDWADRDRFVYSKGHASAALYAVLAERGYFPKEELNTFDQLDSRLQLHPDMTLTPGVDMSTGSLGQGLSAGVGFALAARTMGASWRTFVMIGDGESQEGQVWEAAFVASRYALDNLVAIVDWNGLQQYGWPVFGEDASHRMNPQDRLAEKWAAFGWRTLEIDGNSMPAILDALSAARATRGRPTAVIARTIKGKGVSFMEGDYTWHSKVVGGDELRRALAELHP